LRRSGESSREGAIVEAVRRLVNAAVAADSVCCLNAVMARTLPREFYDRDAIIVARELLGQRLVRETEQGRTVGRIVEVEAYLGARDPASHAYRGMTKRNVSMFGPPGHASVYTIHNRWCMNAVTEAAGSASAVLIRAIEPLDGIEQMQARRRTTVLRDLTRGPARLCEAVAIDKRYDGWDLTLGRELWIEADDIFVGSEQKIVRSGRIGISSAQRRLLRFFLAGNPFVSGRTSHLKSSRSRR
jgi:DNA-3-methyladenine glycosylase